MMKKETASMNIIVKIESLEIEIKELVDEDDSIYNKLLVDTNKSNLVHRDLMRILMKDMMLNYNVNNQGRQMITLILRNFDI